MLNIKISCMVWQKYGALNLIWKNMDQFEDNHIN